MLSLKLIRRLVKTPRKLTPVLAVQVTDAPATTLLMHLPEQMLSEIFRRVIVGDRNDLDTWMCLSSVCRCGMADGLHRCLLLRIESNITSRGSRVAA